MGVTRSWGAAAAQVATVQGTHLGGKGRVGLDTLPQEPAERLDRLLTRARGSDGERVAEGRATHDIDSFNRNPATVVVLVEDCHKGEILVY